MDIDRGSQQNSRIIAMREAILVTSSLSRTITSGRIDVSSKSIDFRLQPTSNDISMRSGVSVENAATELFRYTRSDFTPALLTEVNLQLASSTFIGADVRTVDSPKFDYLAPSFIVQHMEEFCARVRLGDYIGVPEMLWDVHHAINYTGHYFSDGCGRTACLVGAWLSWLDSHRVWILPP